MKYNISGENLNNERRDMDQFFENIIHDLDHKRGDILSIQFWSDLAIIIKC